MSATEDFGINWIVMSGVFAIITQMTRSVFSEFHATLLLSAFAGYFIADSMVNQFDRGNQQKS